jgi:hypothetical protein
VGASCDPIGVPDFLDLEIALDHTRSPHGRQKCCAIYFCAKLLAAFWLLILVKSIDLRAGVFSAPCMQKFGQYRGIINRIDVILLLTILFGWDGFREDVQASGRRDEEPHFVLSNVIDDEAVFEINTANIVEIAGLYKFLFTIRVRILAEPLTFEIDESTFDIELLGYRASMMLCFRKLAWESCLYRQNSAGSTHLDISFC